LAADASNWLVSGWRQANIPALEDVDASYGGEVPKSNLPSGNRHGAVREEGMMIESGRQLAEAGAPIGDPASLRCPPAGEGRAEAANGTNCGEINETCLSRLRLLVSTVESQIIPRLVMAHRTEASSTGPSCCDEGPVSYEEDVRACVSLLMEPSAGTLSVFAEGLLGRGMSLDALYLQVFAPAARQLGEMWTRDECSFTDVTIALGRLQQSLRRFAAHFRPECIDGEPWRRALFAAVPGEQHTFGLSMVVQYFIRAGWDATLLPGAAEHDLGRLVQSERVALVGFTMACESHAPAVKALISRLRSTSRNSALRILVGGVAFSRFPGLGAQVGADGTAHDAQQAVNLAQQLVL
jgi:MerR family transcriptional regulator, light-induced transcriptional regulator